MEMTMEEAALRIAAFAKHLQAVMVTSDDIRRWGGLRDPEEEADPEQDNYPGPAAEEKTNLPSEDSEGRR